MQENRKSIVLTTYACHPSRGSEPGHGWGFLLVASKLAALHNLECICITLPRYVEPIGIEMSSLKLEKSLKIIPVPIPKIFDVPSNGLLLRLGYIYWSLKTRRIINEMDHSTIRVIHHANYASEVLPNPLPKRSAGSVKKILGPLGSSQNLHLSLLLVRDPLDLLILLFDSLKILLTKFLPRIFVPKSAVVVANSEIIADKIYSKAKKNKKTANQTLILYPSLILADVNSSKQVSLLQNSLYHFVIVGVLNRRKKIDFALEVLANLGSLDFHCDIYGEGPEEERLQKHAAELGISKKISWKGTVDRETLRTRLPAYDVVLHPSVREGASTIAGESIIAGVPIIGFEGTGLAGTMSLHELTRYIVTTSKIRSRHCLVEEYTQKVYDSLGSRICIGNPFSLEIVQAQVSRWYELD
jgi:glycosyltransferase involved in cell wall biosynthesis